MPAETLFSICSTLVIPGWLLLVFLPRWKWTLGLISAGIIPFVLGIVYVSLFLSQMGSGAEGGGFGSLAALDILFSNPYSMLAGWIHFLAFDLFIGCWEVHDAKKRGVNHLLVIPCLLLTFMLGPTGLVLYLIIRTIKTRDTTVFA